MSRISKELVVGRSSGCLGGLGEDPLEEGLTTHSSILAWRIHRWRKEPGMLQFMGLRRVGHDRSDLAQHRWCGVACSFSYPALF